MQPAHWTTTSSTNEDHLQLFGSCLTPGMVSLLICQLFMRHENVPKTTTVFFKCFFLNIASITYGIEQIM